MARLHEHQGKAILSKAGIRVPRGVVARSPEEAVTAARGLGCPVMVKVQAWTTGRAAAGGIAKAQTPEEAGAHAARMLGMQFGRFPVTEVLVEECIAIANEYFVSLAIDERERAPILLVSGAGGSGVEERAAAARRVACDAQAGPDAAGLETAIAQLHADAAIRKELTRVIGAIFSTAKACEARSVEVNPLVVTRDGTVVAADCRVAIDDYAVARHPELGIALARELDHPPTALERIAYAVEQSDHRGTFFFAQMNTAAPSGSKGLVGFHGAGGGGSMMSMDAISSAGFTVANFCDTSGNPSPAKVYRAARVILSQADLVGYFGSGSGVANQEQFWSAYGLAKAFWELELDIPAVIRLGGNTEDRAVDILQGACKSAGIPGRVEVYRKNDTPAQIAARFATLVGERSGGAAWMPRRARKPAFVGTKGALSFAVQQGRVWIDLKAWRSRGPAIAARANGLLGGGDEGPVLTIAPEAALSRDSDFIACEVECMRDGIEGVFVELDMPESFEGIERAKA